VRRLLGLGLWLAFVAGWAVGQVVVTSDLLEVHRLEPGSSATVVVTLLNLSDAHQTIRIEVADLREGAGALLPAGSTPRSLGPLVRVGSELTLPPHARQQIPIDIALPLDARGTYFGAVLITPTGEGVATAAQGIAFRELVRYAVELVIDVPGLAQPTITFVDASVAQSEAGVTTFAVTAQNSGERWAERVRYRFELFDAERGDLVMRHEVDRGRLYPGSGHRHRIQWEALAAGDYQLLVIAEAEGGEGFAIRYGVRLSPATEGDPDGPAER